MTNEDWEIVKKAVEIYPNRAKLKIDGYTVDLMLQSVDPYHKEIVIFINGKCKIWALGTTPECEDIRRRFFYSSTKCYIKKPKGRLAKKEQALYQAIYKEYKQKFSVTNYSPFWKSFESLKRHLVKNNTDISIIYE